MDLQKETADALGRVKLGERHNVLRLDRTAKADPENAVDDDGRGRQARREGGHPVGKGRKFQLQIPAQIVVGQGMDGLQGRAFQLFG